MASMWLNGFNPQTKAGGLQSWVNALFDGETPNQAEDRALKAGNIRAQTRHYDAGTGKLNSERALLDDKLGALQDPEAWVSAITGQPVDRVRAVRGYLTGEEDNRIDIPEWTESAPATPDNTMMLPPEIVQLPALADGTPQIPMPGRPELVTQRRLTERGLADSRRIAEALATFIATRQTQPNNPNEVGKAYDTGINRLTTEQILGGLIAPDVGARRVAAADGKALVNMNGAGQVIDNFSGAPGPGNDLLASSVAENLAKAGKDRADATGKEWVRMIVDGKPVDIMKDDLSKAGSAAAFRDPRRGSGGAKEDPIIEVEIPGRGKVKMLQSEYSRAMGRILSREDEQPVKLNTGDIKAVQQTTAAYLDQLEQEQDGTFSPEFRARVAARALELAGTPDYAKNGPAAVQAALEELAPEGFDVSGKWNPFKANTIAPRGGATPAPATPRTPAAPATDMSGKSGGTRPKVARPAGATDAQLMQEANDAIKRGAPRDAVIQRLRDMGVQVE